MEKSAFLESLRAALAKKAEEQGLGIREWVELNPMVELEYSASMLEYMVGVRWGRDLIRTKIMKVADSLLMMIDGREIVAAELIGNLDLRGELYFLRLHKRFGDRIQTVSVEREFERMINRVVVLFKNGHRLTADEGELESTEFLAKCAMVYDL